MEKKKIAYKNENEWNESKKNIFSDLQIVCDEDIDERCWGKFTSMLILVETVGSQKSEQVSGSLNEEPF